MNNSKILRTSYNKIKIMKSILLTVVVLTFIFSTSESQASNNKNNYDGSYNIPFSNSTCGQLGYEYKVKYKAAFNDVKNSGRINKSNCKLVNGNYEGYIYPSNKSHIRIFWKK